MTRSNVELTSPPIEGADSFEWSWI